MTRLVAIHGPDEAAEARVGARIEFMDELDRNDRWHLVTETALRQWYSPKGPGPDLGPPEDPILHDSRTEHV